MHQITSIILTVFSLAALTGVLGCSSLVDAEDEEHYSLVEYHPPEGLKDYFSIEVGDVWYYRYRLISNKEPRPFQEDGEIEIHVVSRSYSNRSWFYEMEDIRIGTRVDLNSSRIDTLSRAYSYQFVEDKDYFVYLNLPEVNSPFGPIARYHKTSSSTLINISGPRENGCWRQLDQVFGGGPIRFREICRDGTEIETDFRMTSYSPRL